MFKKKVERSEKRKTKKKLFFLSSLPSSPRPPGELRDGPAEHDGQGGHEHAPEEDGQHPGVVGAVGFAPAEGVLSFLRFEILGLRNSSEKEKKRLRKT